MLFSNKRLLYRVAQIKITQTRNFNVLKTVSHFTVKFIELLLHSIAHIYTNLCTFVFIIHIAWAFKELLKFSERQHHRNVSGWHAPAKTLTLGIRWANVSATMNIYTTLGQHKSKCVAQQPLFPPFANRSLLPYND